MKSVYINDITLRDGEQTPGVNFFPREKLRIAEQLVKLGVPIIEAGFPVASQEDFQGVKLVADAFGEDVVISAMCRAHKKDIQVAADALGAAKKRRIQVVMGTSDIHLKHKFEMSRNEALDLAFSMVEYAKTFSEDVEFAAEDASRSDLAYLCDVCKACVTAGARTIELPDTVGYSLPIDYANMIGSVVSSVPKNIIVSTHCHDDLGLAVSNTLAGLQAGARQVEVTINGIGERAGNAACEEVIMALKTRQDVFECDTSLLNTVEIVKTSQIVEELSGIDVAFNKAIVGKNAFRHESGIHQDGMIKSPQTYQLMDPKDIGLTGFELKIGKLSGRNALEKRIESLGICKENKVIKEFAIFFKDYAAKKKEVTDHDIRTLYDQYTSA